MARERVTLCGNHLVRSDQLRKDRGGVLPAPAGRRVPVPVWLAVGLAVLAAAPPTAAQPNPAEQPLLASEISDRDVTLHGRYLRRWTEEDGSWVLMFNGGFQMQMGSRRMSAKNAVVWITPRERADGPDYRELTVYLSEDAEVREPGGTVTIDHVLLVRGLRTLGPIITSQDAHVSEPLPESPLYQQALRDRAGSAKRPRQAPEARPEVVRASQMRHPEVTRPPQVVRYRLPQVEVATTPAKERVYVSTGGVYFSQAGGPDAPMLEIRADNAVVFPVAGAGRALLDDAAAEDETDALAPEDAPVSGEEPVPPPRGVQPPPEAPPPPEDEGERGPFGLGEGVGQIRAVYLEGDVVLSMGTRFVRASRLYYDFEVSRAVILDAVFRADMPQRGIPLYMRAAEIRQLSAREVAATHAKITTSEFHTPSYHVGAERVVLRDETRRDADGQPNGPITGSYEMTNTTFNVEGVPISWWPYSRGTLQESETLIRGIRTGYSGDFGVEFESRWYLFNLLGVEPPEGYDSTLRLDYFSDRGPATGVDLDYAQENHYGLFRSYYIHDEGEDNLGPLRRAYEEPSTSERGRVLWRHRHFLPYDWEATVELSYISDDYFLEEYEKSEFHEGKEQETLLYLKRAEDNEAITLLANWRLLDFYTQTEHLPDLTYRRIGDTFLDPIVLYHESRVGAVRYRPDDRFFFDDRRFSNLGRSDVTFRADVRQEAELPLKLGPVQLVPFATVRGTYWDGQPLDDGGLWRGLGVYGVRGGTSFSRVYDEIESELFDIHRIRHIISPDFAAWWGHSNTRSELITPFDYGVETIDDFYGVTAGLRQKWQTKRGPAGARRTVDVLTLNLEVGFFGDVHGRDDESNGYANPLRPENSRTRNYLAGDLIHRLSDTTALLYDFNIDLNDLSYDRHNVSLAIERNPRLAYVVGARYAGDIDMSLVGGGWNYRISQKHITAVRGWWDVDTGELGEITATYIRKLPRWYVGLNFEYDNIDDDFTVSVSVWPEGIPEWTLGSGRFTGLATSSSIRP